MAQTIKLKRSATSGAVPATSALELGEVAINTHDGKMYLKKNDGSESIVEVSGDKLPKSGGTLTGNLVVEDSEVHVGDISADSWTRIKHAQADGYGFDFEHNNATVLVNEQGSTNEALVLGDVDANNTNSGLFGISHTPNSGTTWTKKLDLRGDGDLYVGSSAQNKVWHEGTLTTTNKSNYDTAYTYSQVGHLPVSGGTLTGNLTVNGTITSAGKDVGTQTITSTTPTDGTGFPTGHVWYVV